MSSIDQTLSSLRGAFDQLGSVAQRVARDGAGGDIERNSVELLRIRAQVKADTIALKTAEQTIGSLIDTFA
jgi:hypothetical protein